jgi:uncharacterized protein (DUF362 family)
MTRPGDSMGNGMPAQPSCRVSRGQAGLLLTEWVADCLPAGEFKRVVIKPNWVHHEVSPDFPIRALVTSAGVIEATIEACLARYPGVQEIAVGDVPLQSCDFDLLLAQSGVSALVEKYAQHTLPKITFHDWRRERFVLRDGFLAAVATGTCGDPKGYREVAVDNFSFLEPISHRRAGFGISDFPGEQLLSHHGVGRHRYLISGSVLDADLVINLPKMKTHQKAGITGALKNLVGCNGEKAYLVHYVKGRPCEGGDEFPPDVSRAVRWQVRIREKVQKRSRLLFGLLRPGWLVIKRLWGIQTQGTPEHLGGGRFYQAAGGWYGNDTIWRMVYDLNRIIRYAPAGGGALAATPQRRCVSILDGMVAGEGNGPLQPLPVEANVMVASENPFLVDLVMSRLMGFDWRKIPLLRNHLEFSDEWGRFDPDEIEIRINEKVYQGVMTLGMVRHFKSPPGWRGRIEADDR